MISHVLRSLSLNFFHLLSDKQEATTTNIHLGQLRFMEEADTARSGQVRSVYISSICNGVHLYILLHILVVTPSVEFTMLNYSNITCENRK